MPPKNSKSVNKAKEKPIENAPTIEIGEKIICMQNSYLYEAKCIDLKKEKNHFMYKVHYKKWNSKHDEWVVESRILKYNKKSVREMKKLCERTGEKTRSKKKKKHKKSREKKEKKTSKSTSSESSLGTTDISAPKVLTTPSFVCKQDDFLSTQELKIRIPDELKQILVDDWELIVNQNQLLKLPPNYTVARILSQYYSIKKLSTKLPPNHTIEGYENFTVNLTKYFNFFLEKDLLYPMEHEQLAYLKLNSETLIRNSSNYEILSTKRKEKRQKKHKKSKKRKITSTLAVAITSDPSISSKAADSALPENTSQSESTSDSSENLAGTKNPPDSQSVKEETASSDNTEIVPKIDLTKLYGVMHLLRLFTKLGHYLFFTTLSDSDLTLLNTYIQDFLKYLNKHLLSCPKTLYIDAAKFNEQSTTPTEQLK